MEMTVSSIVQGLLERGHITAEEALVLLKAALNKPCCPVLPVAPYNPPIPYSPPFHVGDPVFPSPPRLWYTTPSTGVNPVTSGVNLTSK